MPHTPLTADQTSKILLEIKRVSDEWFDYTVHGTASLPHEATPDDIWTRYARLINHNMKFCKRLTNIAHDVEPASRISDADSDVLSVLGLARGRSGSVLPEAILSQAEFVLVGASDHAKAARYAAFSVRCLDLPSPNTEPIKESIPEMMFLSSDCFLQLSEVSPGSHGWIFVFRHTLEKALLSTHRFHLTYWEPEAEKVLYGVYHAMRWREADLAGPEFIRMNQSVRNAVVTHASQGPPGSEAFNLTDQAFATSRRTVSCILLQCVQQMTVPLVATSRPHPEAPPRPAPPVELNWPPRLSWPPRLHNPPPPQSSIPEASHRTPRWHDPRQSLEHSQSQSVAVALALPSDVNVLTSTVQSAAIYSGRSSNCHNIGTTFASAFGEHGAVDGYFHPEKINRTLGNSNLSNRYFTKRQYQNNTEVKASPRQCPPKSLGMPRHLHPNRPYAHSPSRDFGYLGENVPLPRLGNALDSGSENNRPRQLKPAQDQKVDATNAGSLDMPPSAATATANHEPKLVYSLPAASCHRLNAKATQG